MSNGDADSSERSLEQGISLLGRVTQTLAAALGYRDLLTRLHSERVNRLAIELGTRCGLDETGLRMLGIAAAFHDVGKIGVPDSILQMQAALDDLEWERMKRHSVIGEELLLATELKSIVPVAKAVRHHHEWFDGSGYPDGLRGLAIPLGARIISVVDAYDAMAVTRPYHEKRNHGQIMEVMLAESGSKFDPEIVRNFKLLVA